MRPPVMRSGVGIGDPGDMRGGGASIFGKVSGAESINTGLASDKTDGLLSTADNVSGADIGSSVLVSKKTEDFLSWNENISGAESINTGLASDKTDGLPSAADNVSRADIGSSGLVSKKTDDLISWNENADWSKIPHDLLGIILAKCSLKDIVRSSRGVCKGWAALSFDRIRMHSIMIPADACPLLLHGLIGNEQLRFYEPFNGVIFEVDNPSDEPIGKFCDFCHHMLVSSLSEGVAIVNILTGRGFDWKLLTMLSDCFIINPSGTIIKGLIGLKGSGHSSTVSLLGRYKTTERSFDTVIHFTISPLSNPILRGNKLYSLSLEGKLGVFDLENNTVNIVDGEEDHNNELENESDDEYEDSDDEYEDSDDDEYSDDEGEYSDDEDEESASASSSTDEDEDWEKRLDELQSCSFLCKSHLDEFYVLEIANGWASVQVKKLDEPYMNSCPVDFLDGQSVFTGTRSSLISVVPANHGNKAFLPGFFGTPTVVRAVLVKSAGRLFFQVTSIMSTGVSSPWCCNLGGNSSCDARIPVMLKNSLWIRMNNYRR